MKIAQLSLAGRGAWPDLHIERLHPQLNVFFGKPGAGKSTVAQLASHLLYGKSQNPWNEQFGHSVPLAPGQLVVESPRGSFILRRHLETDRTPRLTVAGVDGNSVDSRTVQTLLADLSPHVLSHLMAVDFAEVPSIDWLLGKDFARELAKARARNLATTSNGSIAAEPPAESLDRRRVDELIRQRDAINEAIEKRLAIGRQEGNTLADELASVESQLSEKRSQLEAVQADLRLVAADIANCEKRLRYLSLEDAATRRGSEQEARKKQLELATLEAEIASCRKSLSDLQSREAAVRAELAQVAPDGTANRASFLADSRNSLGILERLIDDLDAEVSLLARASQPGRSIDSGAHARLSPVADLIRQQIYTLCGLVTEQERETRRQQLLTESRQLSRSQLDTGERLDHLLARRESLVSELSLSRTVVLRPQLPVTDHCRCEHHSHFINHADPLLISPSVRQSQEADLSAQYESLVHQQAELQTQAELLARQIAAAEEHWQDIQRQRAGLVGNQKLEQQRFELERLEIAIREALKPAHRVSTHVQEVWRASDVLAELTSGQLVKIRLGRDGRSPTVIDRHGRVIDMNSLSTAAHDQLYLSLTLALVASFARCGVYLPLILDEPFLRQEPSGSAAMAGVLAEFARSGHQVLVFTEDMDALRQFEAINSTVFDLARLRRPSTPAPKAETVANESTLTRLVRETDDGQRRPILQFPDSPSSTVPQFYLTEDSSLADFPVLGGGTTQAFAKINIATIGQLLTADPSAVAGQLNRKQVTAETVALWQAHMRLMCIVPGLSLNDAQVLTACGIRSIDDLRKAVPIELETSIRDFLRTEQGQRFSIVPGRFNASQIREWIHFATHRQKSRSNATATVKKSRSTKKTTLRPHRPHQEAPQFYLNRASHVANAPSISPQTARHLASVGIRTVADLLNADAASLAADLGLSHITAAIITQWQMQARLVCQIPDLRGYNAQLLVACGFISPEQIAETKPAELIRQIQAFCQSKQGERILRNHEVPTPAKIKRWCRNAAHHRPLEAA